MVVLNSTIDGSGTGQVGVHSVSGADIRLTSSTVSGYLTGIETGSSYMEVASSIVTENATDCVRITPDDMRLVSTYTGDSSCGTGTWLLSPASSLGFLAPINGCVVGLPGNGCVATRDLASDSNATGGGDCTNVITGISGGEYTTGNVAVDARGFARPSLPVRCDAGAFENEATGFVGLDGLGFVPVSPCAIFDTRQGAGPAAGQQTLTAQITGSVSSARHRMR